MLFTKPQIKRDRQRRSEQHVHAAIASRGLAAAHDAATAGVRAELGMLTCGTWFENKIGEQGELIPAFKCWANKRVKDMVQKVGTKITLDLLKKEIGNYLDRVVIHSAFGTFDCTMDEYRLIQFANQAAKKASQYIIKKGETQGAAVYLLSRLSPFGFSLDSVETLEGVLARLADEYWWRAKLRRLQDERLETLQRDLHYVGGSRMCYLSDVTFRKKSIRAHSNQETLENLYAVSDDFGSEKWVNVAEAASASQSNPINRAAFMAVRIKGLKELAQNEGMEAAFITITAPTRFHSTLKSGQPNPKYVQGCNARLANQWFKSVFQAIRSHWQRQKLTPFGCKVTELHHDGCPHWHILLFAPQAQMSEIEHIMSHHALKDGGDQLKDKKVRFEWVNINRLKGDPVSYVIKYVAKGLDSSHLDNVQDIKNGVTSADENHIATQKMKMGLSAAGIQQFGFFGIPAATSTTWQELRRMGKQDEGLKQVEMQARRLNLSELERFTLTLLYQAADRGDWAAYCIAMGGIYAKRTDAPLKILYSTAEAMQSMTDAVHDEEAQRLKHGLRELNRYGEPPAAKVKGITIKCDWRAVHLVTRQAHYRIVTKAEYQQSETAIMKHTLCMMDVWEKAEFFQQLAQARYEQIMDMVDEAQSRIDGFIVLDVEDYLDQASALCGPYGDAADAFD
ncbi:replication endonuclease [Alteromonas sp. a30]|uniref:replication endonuclease n=1 Tax=Alteromonas sp. a30 TaxID=2730917 RepID=UPI002282265C|nr:replication endonuclease [Alteromonas sp. a30]MCY7295075.1 hypothetical protein [Alteromonas sp. a30]